jgi:hypothetical protein
MKQRIAIAAAYAFPMAALLGAKKTAQYAAPSQLVNNPTARRQITNPCFAIGSFLIRFLVAA